MGLQNSRNWTKVIVNQVYSLIAGATYIHIANLGATSGYWTGDMVGSEPVPLDPNEAYEFPAKESDNYGIVTIDATGTSIKVSMIF